MCVQMQRDFNVRADATRLQTKPLCWFEKFVTGGGDMIVCETMLTWLLAVMTLIIFITFLCGFLKHCVYSGRPYRITFNKCSTSKIENSTYWYGCSVVEGAKLSNVRPSCWGGHVEDQHHKLQPSCVLGSVIWRFVSHCVTYRITFPFSQTLYLKSEGRLHQDCL